MLPAPIAERPYYKRGGGLCPCSIGAMKIGHGRSTFDSDMLVTSRRAGECRGGDMRFRAMESDALFLPFRHLDGSYNFCDVPLEMD